MPQIYRTRIALSGWEGAPGLNTLYWSGGTLTGTPSSSQVAAYHEEIGDAWATIGGYCCDSWTYLVETTVDIIDVESGNIIGIIESDESAPTWSQGTGTISKVARNTVLNIAYGTDVWNNGRRLRGRTFFGPLNAEALGEDGQILSSCVSAVEDALVAITSGVGPRLAVYSRPKAPTNEGFYGDVVSVLCRSKPGSLTSRRD